MSKKEVFSLKKLVEWTKQQGYSLSETERLKNLWESHDGHEVIQEHVDGFSILPHWIEEVEDKAVYFQHTEEVKDTKVLTKTNMTGKESLQYIRKLAPEMFSQSAIYAEAFRTLNVLAERDEAVIPVDKPIGVAYDFDGRKFYEGEIGYDDEDNRWREIEHRIYCPVCNHYFGDYMGAVNGNFCPDCGKRLKRK